MTVELKHEMTKQLAFASNRAPLGFIQKIIIMDIDSDDILHGGH